jgi:predicted dehydrogenase
MGKHHLGSIGKVEGMRGVAACDIDPARTAAASADFPGIETYPDLGEMLAKAKLDLVTVITPHDSHACLALQCLEAGVNVVTEKPFTITAAEATTLIDAAKARGLMVSCFHNRRWDGDYLAIQECVDKGTIGEVFHVEMYGGGYSHPGTWWRSDKQISGGAFYDWGAHFLYWLLRIMPEPIENVTGFFQKRVWMDVTNEDQVQAIIRFKGGKLADVQMTQISKAGKPRWRILGTKGAIVDQGNGSFKVFFDAEGLAAEAEVRYKPSDWDAYYRNVADHLLNGAPLEITPESARRVIAVMEAAEKSSALGQAVPVPYES